MKTSGLTSKGRRETNQDRFYCGAIRDVTVLAVADGMGGHAGGEIASSLAIEAVKEVLHARDAPSLSLKELLRRIFEAADSFIREKRKGNPQLDGMGSTLACLLVRGDRYAAGNIGDSRIYRINGTGGVSLTRDHTMLQEYIDEFGYPVPEDIQRNGHVLSRVADGSGDQPDLFPQEKDVYTLEKDDLFICLTDGLVLKNDQHFEDYLYQSVHRNSTLDSLTAQLLNDALERGSHDNCTVVAGSSIQEIKKLFPNYNRAFTGKAQKTKRSRFRLLRFGLITAGFILLLAFFLAWFNDVSMNDLINRFQMNSENTGNQQAYPVTEDQNHLWPRGFTGLSVTTPYYDGSRITWYSPAEPQADHYHLNVIQDNTIIYQDSTSVTSFVLRDDHGYINGELTIELYATSGDSLFRPASHSQITINYQKNSE